MKTNNISENPENFAKCIHHDRIQISFQAPPETWLKEIDAHLKKHPEKYLRLLDFKKFGNLNENEIDFLQRLKYLKGLSIEFHTDRLEIIEGLTELQALRITIDKKVSLKPLEALKNLIKLSLVNTSKIALDLPDLRKFKNVKALTLVGKFNDIHLINEMPNLQEVTLQVPLENLEFLEPSCTITHLTFNHGINDLKGIEKLSKLELLHLNFLVNFKIEGLEPISKIKGLKTLRIDFLSCIQDFEWLPKAPIEDLYLVGLRNLKSMNGLEKLKNLKLIAAAGTFAKSGQMDLSALLKCKSLKSALLTPSIAKKRTYQRTIEQLKEKKMKTDNIYCFDLYQENFSKDLRWD